VGVVPTVAALGVVDSTNDALAPALSAAGEVHSTVAPLAAHVQPPVLLLAGTLSPDGSVTVTL